MIHHVQIANDESHLNREIAPVIVFQQAYNLDINLYSLNANSSF